MKNINSSLNKLKEAMNNGQYVKAINLCKKILVNNNINNIDILLIYGEALLRNNEFQSALIPCARVIELDSTNIRGLINFGAALLRNNKHSDALSILEYGLSLDPNNFDVLLNICNAYQGLGQPENSLKSALRAIEINPGSFMAYNNLGTALGDLLYTEEARQAYITANVINPNYLPTIINLAQIEIKLGNHKEGIRLYEKALCSVSITSEYTELIKYYLSHSYLFMGDLRKGWDYYDFGFASLLPIGALRSLRKFHKPRWNGNLVDNSRVLIWREQGIGDEILFSTCLYDLSLLNIQVIYECDPRLVNLYKRIYPNINVRPESIDLNNKPIYDDFDFHCPVGSLPKYFRQQITDFDRKMPLWTPLHNHKNDIKNKLTNYKHKILIGISWRSGKLDAVRNQHYTNIADWKTLLGNENYQFVNLQYGDCENEILSIESQLNIKILRWSEIDLRNDIEKVLALVSELDCVASVGTAVSMISAAAGVPTFLLVQRSWDLLGQENFYPWFESVIPFVVEPNEHVGINISKLPHFIKKRNI